jgi:hypothetical protein
LPDRQSATYDGEEVCQRTPPIANVVNARAIGLEDAPKGNAKCDKGVAAKFALDRRQALHLTHKVVQVTRLITPNLS